MKTKSNLMLNWSRYILSVMLIMLFTSFIASAQITYTISKSNNAPTPIASGQPFTYTITYSWSGGAPGTLYIVDNVPTTLDVISALPMSPPSSISGNLVTFVLTGLTLPSGSGTVQINAKFKPGVTCGGTKACNKAGITDNPNSGNFVYSNESCVTAATPTNKWVFEKEWIAGCAIDDQVIYRVKLVNPAGSDIGGINLTNVTLNDFVPAGATVLSVTGNWSGMTGTLLTPSPIPVLQVTPYTQWITAYITVKYPSGPFSAGQTVVNKADLSFTTPCDPKTTTWSDTANVTLCQGVIQGNLGKYLSLSMYFPNNPSWYPVFSPGCCGTYSLYYGNTGTLGQTNFVMEDLVPGEVDVNTIRTYVPTGNTPVTLEVYCWSGASCGTTPCTTATYNTAGWQTMTSLPANICRVKWSYSGTINVSQYLYNYLDVCVRATNFMTGAAVVAPNNITNKVTATATGMPTITVTHVKPVDITQPKVVSTKLLIGDCNNACQVTPSGPFQPGDTVRFRMAVANIGNAAATSCTINDLLPTGLSYVGNETYYYGTFNWMVNIYNPPCCSLAVAIPSAIGGTITTPAVGATNLNWTFPLLPGRCDGLVDYFLIDFDVKISDTPPAPPGQYVNTFAFSASNVPSFNSNPAYLTVNATAQLQTIKQVRKKGSGAPWSYNASILPGGIAEYQLTVKNTGNTPLSNLCLLDIMPWVGDIKVLPAYTSRGSMFNMPYNPADGLFAITPAVGFNSTYNTAGLAASQNPMRSTECGGFCGVADPPGATAGIFGAATTTYSFKVNANAGVYLAPGASLDVIVPVKVPSGNVKPKDNACNSFAVQAIPVGISNVCLSAESNPACVTVAEDQPCFRIAEQRINCVGQSSNGNWLYQLSMNLTNLSGANGFIQVTPSVGTIVSVNPTALPNGVPTNVNVNLLIPGNSGLVCFTIVLLDQKQNKLCDTTICIDYMPCPEPCPCPFKIIIEKPSSSQASGNLIYTSNVFTIVGTNIQKVKATIISSSVTQYCKGGGVTTYTPAATIHSSSWNPLTAIGFGTSEVSWTNLLCPPMNNKFLGLYLNIPTAPGKNCYQIIKVCIRYSFTDCKCNTCDTVVCYEIYRKWMPFTDHGNMGDGVLQIPGIDDYNKGGNTIQAVDEPFVQFNMSTGSKGTLTIMNPSEDEYTTGTSILSVNLSTSPGVRPLAMQANDKTWTDGIAKSTGMKSFGQLDPGKKLSFNVEFDNKDAFKKWINTLEFTYKVKDIPDTLSGIVTLNVRTPGTAGGDILSDNLGNVVKNARTFALSFQNANVTKDSITKLTIRIKEGSILAMGPNISNQEYSLNGYIASGYLMLLPSAPDASMATPTAISAGSNIGPLYITVASDDQNKVVIEYVTQTNEGDIVTEGTLELTIPISGVKGGEGDNNATVWLSDAQPNPTDGNTTIKFNLSEAEEAVSLVVSDMRGSKVATLIENKPMGSGQHEVVFNPGLLPNGVYYYTIRAGKATQTNKIVILK